MVLNLHLLLVMKTLSGFLQFKLYFVRCSRSLMEWDSNQQFHQIVKAPLPNYGFMAKIQVTKMILQVAADLLNMPQQQIEHTRRIRGQG